MKPHHDNEDSRDRPTVLLLHSLGTDRRLWRYQIDSLSTDYDVIAPDCRGHGGSMWSEAVTVDDWVDDIHRVVREHCGVHVIGLSMGGIQAIAFAGRYPDLVKSVTIANAFAKLPEEVADARVTGSATTILDKGMGAFAKEYLDQTLTQSLDASDYESLFEAIASMSPDAYLASASATFRADVIADLAHITCPALVVTGELDAKIPDERTAEIVAGITDVRHSSIPRAGHLSCIENPTHFNNVVKSFLARVDDRAVVH